MGQSPGGEQRREVLAVDGPVTVDVAGAGGRAVVARSAFGPAAAEFGAGGFGVDRAATCDTACAGRYWFNVVDPDGVGLILVRDHGIEVAVAVEVAEGD